MMGAIKLGYRTLVWALIGLALLWLGTVALWNIRGGTRGGTPMGTSDRSPLQGLSDFGQVPEFTLTERSGNPLRLQDLGGYIWIVNFIYTACTETCPLQSAAMAALQSQLDPAAKVKLISITLDPERDTLAVLSRYAQRFGANGDRWLFLTGPKDMISQLAGNGFRLSAVPVVENNQTQTTEFIHSSRLVLVDGAAKIRGYYPSNDTEALRQLVHDVKLLLNRNDAHG
jgi:protein SCO1/2